MKSYVDTVVVGGGQAGLSVSWHLTNEGRDHMVLDQGRIGDTWRKRWDTFCLVTPNKYCQLPGFPYDGDNPDGFMNRDEIVDYVERFAKSFNPPYHAGVRVNRISKSENDGRYLIETSDGNIETENVIVTVGTHQHPNIPEWGTKFDDSILQMHTRDYVNPELLLGGGVLIVGSGQSGCQVAEDLHGSGRDVHLCVGSVGRIPRRYRGRDIVDWADAAGMTEIPIDKHPKGPGIRFKPHEHLSGRDGGHTIDLRQLALNGIHLHGRLLDADGTTVSFADDLSQNLDNIDEECTQMLDMLDQFIEKNGVDAPPNDIQPVNWRPSPEPNTLDIKEAGINTVIYATGFHRDFSWIDLPAFDETGYPIYERGITKLPGLYFVGLHWLYTSGSGLFYQVGRDAKYVIDHLERE